MTQLQNLMSYSLTHCPDQVAIQFEQQTLTYKTLSETSQKLANGMREQGVKCGDRVAWFMPNCPEAVMISLACYQLGAISVPLNDRFLTNEASYVLEQTDTSVLFFHAIHTEIIDALLAIMPTLKAIAVKTEKSSYPTFEQILNTEPLLSDAEISKEHPALILYTSGTTAKPKGVVHSHDSAFNGINISRQIFDITSNDIILVGKPISHAGGLETQLMPTLLAGGTAILDMKPSPKQAVNLIQKHQVTQYAMLASDLLDFIETIELKPIKLSSLKNCIGSGDAIPTDLHHRFRDLFGWELMEGCGMTEIGGYYAMNPRYGTRKWGSLGLATPSTELQILGNNNQQLGVKEIGEIVLCTPASTTGYWKNSVASDELFRGNWLHTGDLAYRDEDDYIWFVGRKKLMIVRRGSNIAPTEVENIIDQFPGIHASVVVGVKDVRDGQVPVAFVTQLKTSVSPSENQLRDFVAERLAAYKNPVRYFFFDELPKNHTGKFDRHLLAQMAKELMSQNFNSSPDSAAFKTSMTSLV